MEQLDLQQLQQLIFLFVGLVFATLAALVVYVIVANRHRRAKIAQTHKHDDAGLPAARHVTGQVLALVREKAGEPLQVEIGGTRYRRLADIEDLQIKRQVVESARELIQFTGVLGKGAIAPAPLEKTHSWREDVREGSQGELDRIHAVPADEEAQPQPTPAPTDVEQRFLSLLAEMGQAQAKPEKPSLVSSIQHTLRPKVSEPDRTRTFVHEIEDIVQRRIGLIPALQGRSVHVRPDPGGSVHFVFEGQEYKSLDDIPNLTARQLIKDAIQEWDETT